MNRTWAESDESAMLAVHRRNREVNESKIKFQVIDTSVFCPPLLLRRLDKR